MTKLFNITDFNLWEKEIEVLTDKKDYFIPRQKFEDWLRWDDRLNWEMNYSDHNGDHKQETGVMSLEEYWSTDQKGIKEDLYDYIVTKIIGARVFEIKPALNNILEHAFSHVS